MKITASRAAVPTMIFIYALLGAPASFAAAADGLTKSFDGSGATCNAAKAEARHAARKWRSDHCKSGHTTVYTSHAQKSDSRTVSAAGDAACDQGKDGLFSISRKVVCLAPAKE